jgi:hypothetical protein
VPVSGAVQVNTLRPAVMLGARHNDARHYGARSPSTT